MMFPFQMFIMCNMAMRRNTSNSNTCISQNIPGYEMSGFVAKNENMMTGVYIYIRQHVLS